MLVRAQVGPQHKAAYSNVSGFFYALIENI